MGKKKRYSKNRRVNKSGDRKVVNPGEGTGEDGNKPTGGNTPEKKNETEVEKMGAENRGNDGLTIDQILENEKIAEYISGKIKEGLEASAIDKQKPEKPKGTTPKSNPSQINESEVKRFKKMSYKERVSMFNADPEQYNELVKLSK